MNLFNYSDDEDAAYLLLFILCLSMVRIQYQKRKKLQKDMSKNPLPPAHRLLITVQ